MTGISGTGRAGKLHFYYVCQKRRTEKTCHKKNVRRDVIELKIAKAIRDYALKDDIIEWIADSCVEDHDRRVSESHLSVFEDQLAEVNRSIKNVMSAIEKGIITETTKGRLMELEAERTAIEGKICAAKAAIVPTNRERLVEWLRSLREGDVHDKKYQAGLFDTFLVAAYLYDDNRVKIVFSFAGDKNTIEIPLEDVIDSIDDEASCVRLSSTLSHQIKNPNLCPKGQRFGFFLFAVGIVAE